MMGTLRGIQALRAIAALMVVAYHAAEVWSLRVASGSAAPEWGRGAAGVDLFFVISGVVMVLSAARLRGLPDAAWRFLRQRLERIVPFYWLMTAAKLAVVIAVPWLALRTPLDWDGIARSFLLLPVHDAAGLFRPVLPVGWTLSFELLFYLLVAAALWLRAPVLWVVPPALAALAVASLARTAAWPAFGDLADPIVLEFLLGAGIGTLALQGRCLAPAAAGGLLAIGCCAFLLSPAAPAAARMFVWGLPAAAVVAGTIGLEPALRRTPAWLLGLGDASYAIYLTHGFLLPVIGIAVARSGLGGGLALWTTLVAGLAGSALLGVAAHRAIEAPLLHAIRRRPPIPVAG